MRPLSFVALLALVTAAGAPMARAAQAPERNGAVATAAENGAAADADTLPKAADVVPLLPGAAPYNYNSDGRRDPFVNLIAPTATETKAPPRPAGSGLGAIRVEDLAVRGIMQSRERLVAMIQGPDNRTYLIHQGDKLADGAVKTITPQGLVLLQDVSDPRAKEKTREVRKLLRALEDEKE